MGDSFPTGEIGPGVLVTVSDAPGLEFGVAFLGSSFSVGVLYFLTVICPLSLLFR